jgi:hypothetical protein
MVPHSGLLLHKAPQVLLSERYVLLPLRRSGAAIYGTAAASGVDATVLSAAAPCDPLGLLGENVREAAFVPCQYGATS